MIGFLSIFSKTIKRVSCSFYAGYAAGCCCCCCCSWWYSRAAIVRERQKRSHANALSTCSSVGWDKSEPSDPILPSHAAARSAHGVTALMIIAAMQAHACPQIWRDGVEMWSGDVCSRRGRPLCAYLYTQDPIVVWIRVTRLVSSRLVSSRSPVDQWKRYMMCMFEYAYVYVVHARRHTRAHFRRRVIVLHARWKPEDKNGAKTRPPPAKATMPPLLNYVVQCVYRVVDWIHSWVKLMHFLLIVKWKHFTYSRRMHWWWRFVTEFQNVSLSNAVQNIRNDGLLPRSIDVHLCENTITVRLSPVFDTIRYNFDLHLESPSRSGIKPTELYRRLCASVPQSPRSDHAHEMMPFSLASPRACERILGAGCCVVS